MKKGWFLGGIMQKIILLSIILQDLSNSDLIITDVATVWTESVRKYKYKYKYSCFNHFLELLRELRNRASFGTQVFSSWLIHLSTYHSTQFSYGYIWTNRNQLGYYSTARINQYYFLFVLLILKEHERSHPQVKDITLQNQQITPPTHSSALRPYHEQPQPPHPQRITLRLASLQAKYQIVSSLTITNQIQVPPLNSTAQKEQRSAGLR